MKKPKYNIDAFESTGSTCYFYLRAPFYCDYQSYDFVIETMKEKGFEKTDDTYLRADSDCLNDCVGWALHFRKIEKKVTQKSLGI